MKKRNARPQFSGPSHTPAGRAHKAWADALKAFREGRYIEAKTHAELVCAYRRMDARLSVPEADRFAEERLDAAGEQALRDELLRRLDALEEDIAANGGVRP